MKKTLIAVLLLLAVLTSVGLAACNNDTPTPDGSKTLTDIEIVKQPTKLTYTEGEYFDISGIKVEAIYSDGSRLDVTSKVTTNADGKALKASTKSVFVIYKETIDGKEYMKNKAISITVQAEEVIHPDVITDYVPTSAELPHNVIKTSDAAMLFYTNYDSTTMKCEAYLELTPDATDANKGTFVFGEMTGHPDKAYKMGKLTGTYVIDGDKMTLQSAKLYIGTKPGTEEIISSKYSNASKEIATIVKEGDKIVGLNFGKMSGDDKFWGWSKSKAAAFVENLSTAHNLSADTAYMEVVNNNTMSANMKSYYIVESATLDGIETLINPNGYFVGDKLNLPETLTASVKYVGTEAAVLLANNFAVNIKRGDELLAADVALEKGDKLTITVDGVATDIALTVKDVPVSKTLTSIEITTAPTKTDYAPGEKFDPTGMKVTAKYSTGAEDDVVIDDLTKLTITIGEADYKDVLLSAATTVNVSYTEGDVTVQAVGGQAITVTFNYVEPRTIATTSTANYTFITYCKKANNQEAMATVELFGDLTAGGKYQTTILYTKKSGSTVKFYNLAYIGTYTVSDGKINFAAPLFLTNTDTNTTMWYNNTEKALSDETYKANKELIDTNGITATITKDGDNVTSISFAASADDITSSFFMYDTKGTEVVCELVVDHTISATFEEKLPDVFKANA